MIKRILIADDHGIVRMGIAQIIKELFPHSVLKEVEDYKELFETIRKEEYNLLILDINMPNGTFQEAVDFIKIKQPKLKILIFSSQDEQLYAIRYLKMGADGFLNKFSSKEEINRALNGMMEKGRYYSEDVKETLLLNSINKQESSNNPLESLSNRELEIAKGLTEGASLKDLSAQFNLHSSTISTYKTRIFQKLGIQSIPDLIEVFKLYQI